MPRFRGVKGRPQVKGPLALIIRRGHRRIGVREDGSEVAIPREVLICGHIVRVRTDIFGETNAYKRRCEACGKLRERIKAL